MPERRPIDITRDSGGHIKIGPPESTSPITEMCELGGFLCAIKTDGIYEIKLPDQVDPHRINPALPKSQRQVLAYGSDCEIVVRTLLTANALFKPEYLGSTFDRKQALDLAFSALRDLISMHEMATSLEAAQAEAKVQMTEGGTLFVPSVPDIIGRCKAFIQKADHAYRELLKIAELFYGDLGSKHVDRLTKLAENRHAKDAGLVRFLKKVGPFLQFVRRARNCVEHPKENQRIIVEDFTLSAVGTIVPPTIEVIDIEKPHPQIGVLDFMKAVTDRLSQIFEVMIASLCGHNTKALGGLPIVMMELPADQRSASHVRFSYGLQDGSRIVPMM
jgi:hypothetical protein